MKDANLKVKVGCGSIDSANGAEGRTNLGPCAIGDDGSSGKLLEPCARTTRTHGSEGRAAQ